MLGNPNQIKFKSVTEAMRRDITSKDVREDSKEVEDCKVKSTTYN